MLVDKPLRWTSFDVVNKIRGCLFPKYGRLKVGHAGTLDPLATGLVIICVGRWTKDIERYMGERKEYEATLKLGETTPSFDRETEVNAEYPWHHIDREMFDRVLTGFVGEIEQKPPAYSAIRIDGKKAYEKARKGRRQEMPVRKVYVKAIEVLDFQPPFVRLRIECGKGTYIRSLADDIGRACGSGACLHALRRTVIGDYRVEDASTMEEVIEELGDKTGGLEVPRNR